MFKQKSDSPAARSEPADAVQQARTRARHRLIGAVVLLAVGIIGFPLVFETQPRPIPVDIPIEIPRRDAMPPLAMPAPPSSPAPGVTAARDGMITESSGDAGRDVTPARTAAPAVPAQASQPARRAVASASAAVTTPAPAPTSAAARGVASAPTPARVAETPTRAARGDGDRARALLEGRPVVAAPASVAGERFVVQVGAFADAEAAREARKHADKLGLKTYTQVAQTASGSRIRVRVGPFVTRAEADAAMAKAKAAGLAAVVLTL